MLLSLMLHNAMNVAVSATSTAMTLLRGDSDSGSAMRLILEPPHVDAAARCAQHETRASGVHLSDQRILGVLADDRHRQLAVDAAAAGVRIEVEVRVRRQRDRDAA